MLSGRACSSAPLPTRRTIVVLSITWMLAVSRTRPISSSLLVGFDSTTPLVVFHGIVAGTTNSRKKYTPPRNVTIAMRLFFHMCYL